MFVFLPNPLHPLYPISFPDFLNQYPPAQLSYVYTYANVFTFTFVFDKFLLEYSCTVQLANSTF